MTNPQREEKSLICSQPPAHPGAAWAGPALPGSCGSWLPGLRSPPSLTCAFTAAHPARDEPGGGGSGEQSRCSAGSRLCRRGRGGEGRRPPKQTGKRRRHRANVVAIGPRGCGERTAGRGGQGPSQPKLSWLG